MGTKVMHFTLGLIVCSKTYAISSMLTAIIREDCTDRRRRQQQGIDKLKAESSYKVGRTGHGQRNETIMIMLRTVAGTT